MNRRATKIILAIVLMHLAACSWRFNWPEHRVAVVVPTGAPESLIIRDETFALNTAVVTLETIELLSCEDVQAPSLPGFAALAEILVPAAHAHGVSTPTLAAIPVVVDLRAKSAKTVADLQPPSGEYCMLRVMIGPADDDAVDLAIHPEILGQSLDLDLASSNSTIALHDSRRTEILIDLEALFGEPLVLGETSREVEVVVDLNLELWFADIEVLDDRDAMSGEVLGNVPLCATGELP